MYVQGRGARKGHLHRRITVTSSIFNFSTRFFAQIVENRETQLSSIFLGPGGNFSKSYDETRFRKVVPALNLAWADRSEIGIPRTCPNLRGIRLLIAVIFEHAQ